MLLLLAPFSKKVIVLSLQNTHLFGAASFQWGRVAAAQAEAATAGRLKRKKRQRQEIIPCHACARHAIRLPSSY